jgi:hypothetical protein
MSVRVVNVTGVNDEDVEEEAVQPQAETSALQRSPSGFGRGRRRSSAVLAERRASKATLAERRASKGGLAVPEELKIAEDEEDEAPENDGKDNEDVEEEEAKPEEKWVRAVEKKERAYRQLRGKTLGVFGPDNMIRQAAARVLTLPYVSSFLYATLC